MKTLFKLACCFSLLSVLAFAQGTNQQKQCPQQFDKTVSVSATTITIPNDCGAVRFTVEEIVTGGPASMSAVFSGCMRGGSACTALDTNTSTTSITRKPVIDTVYDYFTLTATWSGGTSPTFAVHTTSSIASAGGGSTLIGDSPIVISGGHASCPTCGTSTGNVTGAASSATNNAPVFGDTTGKVLADSGGPMPATASPVATQVVSGYNKATGTFSQRTLVTGDIPNNGANTTGTAGGLSANIAESQTTNLVTDLAAKAPLASPALTGTPTVPTAAPGTNTTQAASTAYADAIAALKANIASPTFTGTVGGITNTMVGLGSVTNDAQTKAAIVPNTVPSAAQMLLGNAGGTAFAPVSITGPCSFSSLGVMSCASLVATTTTVNGHALSSNVVVSATDITTGTLPHAQLPTLVSGDIPNNAANTSGLAGTATALATLPTTCGTNVAASGVLANGNATGCFTPTGSGTVNSGTANQMTFYATSTTAVSPNPRILENGNLFTVSENADVTGNHRTGGPGPHIDVTAKGIVGDAKISKNVNISAATVTIASGSATFAATDCQSGTGCTGTVNKVFAVSGGGPSGTITIAAPTPGANGNLISSINYRWQAVEVIDTGTLGTAGNTVNGWSLPTAEATVAEGANTSLAFPAASANLTNATGLRLYVASPFATATANAGDEVLQVPGKVAFGTVTSAGTGCTTGNDALTIAAPSQAGGIQAVAHAICAGGALTSVVIDITGSGYTSNPTVSAVATGTGTVSLTLGLLCSAQSAKNFRDSACDIGSTQTLASLVMVGPPVPTVAGWRSVLNSFTSTTVMTIADTIPNNLSGGANFAAWATDNTAAWNANVVAFAPCQSVTVGILSTSGCHIIFPSVGSNGAPTGRYFFLNGLIWNQNGSQIEGKGGRGSTPNGGIAIATTPTPSAEIVTFGDTYAINIGSNTGSFQGFKSVGLNAEDILPGLSWGCYNVGGDYGVSLTATHVQLKEASCHNFVSGYGIQLTNIQRVEIYSPWLHAGTAFRFNDSVSATMVYGGMVSGGGNTTGPGSCIWISNNPIVNINQFGNITFWGTQCIDFYQGDIRISDSSYNRFFGMKRENISLSGGGSCPGGGTACYGASFLTEGFTSSRCVNNGDYQAQSARNVNYLSETIPIPGGTACSNTDIVDPIYTQGSGGVCAQSPCNTNDLTLDLKLGNNGQTLAQASIQSGGQSFGPDVLSGATPAIKCEKGNVHQFRAMGQNIVPTFSSTSCADGQEITIEACENSGGGFTFTFPAAFQNTTAITTTANACTTEVFHWDATNAVAVRDMVTAGSSLWSGLSAPTGNLSLAMTGHTSIFSTTTALAQMFALKNSTAAVVGTSQGSPHFSLCGRAWTGSDVEDCLDFAELPGNGVNAAITFAFTHTGTSTGVVTTTFPGPVSAGGSGVLGQLALNGSTSGTATVTAPAVSGTLSNAIAFSNAISTGTPPTLTTPPGAGGYLATEGTEPTGVPAATTGIIQDSTSHCNVVWNNGVNVGCIPMTMLRQLTADWTCGTGGINTTCVAAGTIGTLTWTLPLVAANWSMDCSLVVGQATAVTANNWNLQTATNGATNVEADYAQNTAATAVTSGVTTGQASTTTTFNIGGTWTQGATATKMPVKIHATIEGSSASGTVVNLQLVAPTVADLVTIYRGSSCLMSEKL